MGPEGGIEPPSGEPQSPMLPLHHSGHRCRGNFSPYDFGLLAYPWVTFNFVNQLSFVFQTFELEPKLRYFDKDNLQQFLDVRGRGAIQNMGFKTEEEAMAFQDRIRQWVTDVINEKLNTK